jgi:hypothetical protein
MANIPSKEAPHQYITQPQSNMQVPEQREETLDEECTLLGQ